MVFIYIASHRLFLLPFEEKNAKFLCQILATFVYQKLNKGLERKFSIKNLFLTSLELYKI